ncbi:MAG: helix-turn-helix domain-containing protein [Pseudonocardiaceae bacterium]
MATTFSGWRVRGHRDGQGLRLCDLGIQTEIHPNTIRSYESGQAQPPARRLPVLADALGVAIEDLFARYPDDPMRDYIDAVASHGPPLSDEVIAGAAQVLRMIRRIRPAAAGLDAGRARVG